MKNYEEYNGKNKKASYFSLCSTIKGTREYSRVECTPDLESNCKYCIFFTQEIHQFSVIKVIFAYFKNEQDMFTGMFVLASAFPLD